MNMVKPVPSSNIKILPEQLINKIAAGEVVERPASIVKELIENAIDAGADQISVTIKNGGKDLISVLDNGTGMDEDNARLAVERHATSKIYSEQDLEHIDTLGFRGEALASIASVSHFELLTCHHEEAGASRLFIKGGYLEEFSKTGFPQGTKITIQQLFFNTPARLKFMKTTPTEFRHIQETVLHQALARPHIQFRLTHNQQLVFSLSKGQTLEQRIYQLFGDEFQDGLIPLEHQETYLKYDGFASIPTHTRSSKRWQYLFVNDRFVKCPAVNRAVYDAYRTLLMKNQHPVFFLKIYLDPSEIDVNVHPAKTEIRFRNSQLIHTILVDHLGKALLEASHRRHFSNQLIPQQVRQSPASSFPSSPSSHSGSSLSNPPPSTLQEQLEMSIDPEPLSKPNQVAFQKSLKLFANIDKGRKKKKTKGSAPNKRSTSSPPSFSDVHQKPPPTHLEDKKETFMEPETEKSQTYRVLGQINQVYILVEKKEGLVLFDQHAASERVLFEQYQQEFFSGRVQTETFLVPILLDLSPQNAILLEQHLPHFKKLGFEIEPFGKTTYSIHSIPLILSKDACQSTILAILDELSLFGKSKQKEEIFNHVLEKVACHSAVHSGAKMEMEEMNRLVSQLEEIDIQLFRPHEQPILVEFSYQELKKRFKRST